MKLFGYLPETLFQPLAGPKKHVYARLLMRLYERVFAARVLETPTKDELLRHIANALAEAGVSDSADLHEDEIDAGPNPYAHYLAYNRLKNAGWLVEAQEKWDVLVEMHPDALVVMGAIADFANSRIRVAGAVVEVKSNLESAAREPEAMAQGLANACETAVRFARNMRRILVGMRNIEERILGNPDASSILRTFFRDFVDGLLIADYKQLKTSNNPYRYRRQISALAAELLHNDEWRGKLARAYIDQGVVPAGPSRDAAEDRVVSELEKIRQVFDDVGPFMERIDDFRSKLEQRVRTTVHYMDVMGEGSAERLARVIEKLSVVGAGDVLMRLRAPDVGFPISEKALYTPPPPRAAPEKTRFKLPSRDPYLKAYVEATTAFDRMVRVTPEKMIAFIDAKIGDSPGLHSTDIVIDSIEELLAFRSLPALVSTAKYADLGAYRITPADDRTANEWIDLPAFRVDRRTREAMQC